MVTVFAASVVSGVQDNIPATLYLCFTQLLHGAVARILTDLQCHVQD